MKVIKTDTESHEPWTILPTQKEEKITAGGMHYHFALELDKNKLPYIYFIVVCTYDIIIKDKTVFVGETQTVYTIENNHIAPTVDFLFEKVKEARSEFARIFKETTAKYGQLSNHVIPEIKAGKYQDKLRELLQEAILKAFPNQ